MLISDSQNMLLHPIFEFLDLERFPTSVSPPTKWRRQSDSGWWPSR
jgi:hypothetical protein